MAAEELKKLELTQRSFTQDFFREDIGDFLDGHKVAVVGSGPIIVLGGTDDSVGAMTELLDDLEPLIDDKFLAKHGVDGFTCH